MDHFVGWTPSRPFLFGTNVGFARELQTCFAHANAISAGDSWFGDQIQKMRARQNQKLARFILGADLHVLWNEFWVNFKSLRSRWQGSCGQSGC